MDWLLCVVLGMLVINGIYQTIYEMKVDDFIDESRERWEE